LIYAARRVKRYSASSPLDIDLSAGRSHIDDAYREAGAGLKDLRENFSGNPPCAGSFRRRRIIVAA